MDGDTFDIRIEQTDPRVTYEIERVRLADVDSPEMSTPEGPIAKEFARAILLNRTVWLDIDDRAEGGRRPYDRLICVVYLTTSDGQPIASPPFNRILVGSGYAEVKDFDTNEFDPATWWEPGSQTGYMFEKAAARGVGYKNVEALIQTTTTTATDVQFVGSTESDKYHYPSYRWAKKILPQNQIWFSSSGEARAAGYVPCGVCKPP